jgi:iron complex transport system ATP-binding protein
MLAGEALTVRYPGARDAALSGASLAVGYGEAVGILGPNGSGKSTLLAALSGLLPLEKGHVSLDGRPLAAFSRKERARRMAWVPQRAGNAAELTVEDMVLMGRYAHLPFFGRYTARDRAIASEAMRETDVLAFARRGSRSLSGGEFQRVLAARAFAQCSGTAGAPGAILILDEAGSGLDPAHSLALFDAVAKRARKTKAMVLTAMHDLNMAALYCERLVFLKRGRILAQGPTRELFTADTLEAVYETRFSVFAHPALNRPQALLLPGETL